MQVMVLEQDQQRQAQLARALMEKGFHVLCVESLDAAECFVRMDVVDVLVLGERVGGRLSHSLALLAECRNPMVSAILLTERSGPDMDELFDLIPAVYAILGRDVAPRVVTQIVMAAITAQVGETPHARVARRWQAAEAAAALVDDADFADVGLRDDRQVADVEVDVTQVTELADESHLDVRATTFGHAATTPAGEPRTGPVAHEHPAIEPVGQDSVGIVPASSRWLRSGRIGIDAQDAGFADFDGPVVSPPAGMLRDLPVFVPVALMAGDAPRRRLHLG
jgi:DNA-binding response OmpR family regulator